MTITTRTSSVDFDDPITLQVLWNRLISITDQADAALGRAAFSPIVREQHDYVTVLLDARGNSLAQCTYSIPSFIGTLPITTRHCLDVFPPEQLEPGDVLITNDPWLATGHLPDITIIQPIFRNGQLVAFAGNIAHVPDIGGRPYSPDGSDLHEEGIRIPILKLIKKGKPVEEIFSILHASVRIADAVLGDIQSQIAANRVMEQHLNGFMDEYGIHDLAPLASAIHRRSETSMRRAIRELPDGHYPATLTLDGFDEEIILKATVEVGSDSVHVDFTGTSPQSSHGINVVINYQYALTAYALKCLLDPEPPNSEGSFAPITTFTPEGSILNPRPPAAVNGRALVGHALPSLVFKALADVLPDRVQADSGGAPIWGITAVGEQPNGDPFVVLQFNHGGQGGRDGLDGIDCLSFPSNARTVPVEALEAVAPILVEEKQLITDSGGPGQYRGGCGQRTVFRNRSNRPIQFFLRTERVENPPFGILGGSPGRAGAVARLPGSHLVAAKGKVTIAPGEALVMETPGGGGYGIPADRDPDLVELDLKYDLISPGHAQEIYGRGD